MRVPRKARLKCLLRLSQRQEVVDAVVEAHVADAVEGVAAEAAEEDAEEGEFPKQLRPRP
jgi:hypothetical protein